MKSVRIASLPGLLLFVLAGATAVAGPINVDGSWSDWGIDPNSGDWTSSNSTRVFFEDYTGTDGHGYIGPGWGGQFFDVEAIYAQYTASTFCFAIVTGFDPDGVVTGGTTYTPGDIFLNAGNGWKVGIDLETGKVYNNATSSVPGFAAAGPFTITGGTHVGNALLSVPFDGVMTSYGSQAMSSKHYLFEGCLDLALIGGLNSSPLGIHWTMSCGNDVGEGFLPRPPAVPEPATMGLLGLGGLAALLGRRRARGKK